MKEMSTNEYQKLAISTESLPTTERFHRYLHIRPRISSLLNGLRKELEEVDAIKKYIFYGKESVKFGYFKLEDYQIPNRVQDMLPEEVKFLRLLHAVLGIMSECEEWVEPILIGMQAVNNVDRTNAQEELGDPLWYIAIGADSLGLTLEQIMRINVAKLAKRFPEKFTEFHAINRDTAAERTVMENSFKK